MGWPFSPRSTRVQRKPGLRPQDVRTLLKRVLLIAASVGAYSVTAVFAGEPLTKNDPAKIELFGGKYLMANRRSRLERKFPGGGRAR